MGNYLGLQGAAGLVTAAGDGIGRASAVEFAKVGANVLILDLNAESLEETAKLVQEQGGEVEILVGDASKESVAQEAVNRVVERWGKLDFAHNNAGIGTPSIPFVDQTLEAWQRVLDLNILGTMLFMQHELRQMQEQGFGAIVNTSSMSGKSGSPGLAPYNASKWAINGITQTAAVEFAPLGIRVNAILPGATLTTALQKWKETSPEGYKAAAASIPMKRMATVEEQAAAAVWLCSPRASYITGTLLNVEGGDGILGKQS